MNTRSQKRYLTHLAKKLPKTGAKWKMSSTKPKQQQIQPQQFAKKTKAKYKMKYEQIYSDNWENDKRAGKYIFFKENSWTDCG